jgi:hypothetical protein
MTAQPLPDATTAPTIARLPRARPNWSVVVEQQDRIEELQLAGIAYSERIATLRTRLKWWAYLIGPSLLLAGALADHVARAWGGGP